MIDPLVLVRGAGRLGTAVAHRLRLAGFPVVMTEAPRPTLLHRRAAFGAVVDDGEITIEGVTARRVADGGGLRPVLEEGAIPVLVDPAAAIKETLRPRVLVDAIGLDRNVGTRLTDAPIVIALGVGFEAGREVHAVVESRANADIGRFTTSGALRPSPPALGAGPSDAGLVHAAIPGRFAATARIGDAVRRGDPIGAVGGRPVLAPVDGLMVGLLADGLFVGPGVRLADVDPRGAAELIDAIDPLARAAAGGVLEALLYLAALDRHEGPTAHGATTPA
jgi:xanthine dehydrogenase accessory factor